MIKTKYILLGGLFQGELEKEFISNAKNNIFAANVFQWNLVEGIKNNINSELCIVSAPYVGYFPKYYGRLFVPSQKTHILEQGSISITSVGFCNVFGIKEIERQKKIYRELKKNINCGEEKVVIIIYAMNTALIKAALRIKSYYKGKVHICLVCPDLPQYMNVGIKRGKLFALLKKMDNNAQKKMLKKIDSFVFLTEYMNQVVNEEKKPWCVVEGIVSLKQSKYDVEKKKTILYAGGICEEYGVYDLLNAFQQITHNDWKLVLCGAVEECIREKYESREIEFKGMVSNETVKFLEYEASLLVNPRPNQGDYVRFSFPSKTLEYMSSGTPVLMYNLEGMPKEYLDYVYTVESNGGNLKNALSNVLNMQEEELLKKGKEAQKFVLSQKNANIQAKKIIDMINGATI